MIHQRAERPDHRLPITDYEITNVNHAIAPIHL